MDLRTGDLLSSILKDKYGPRPPRGWGASCMQLDDRNRRARCDTPGLAIASLLMLIVSLVVGVSPGRATGVHLHRSEYQRTSRDCRRTRRRPVVH